MQEYKKQIDQQSRSRHSVNESYDTLGGDCPQPLSNNYDKKIDEVMQSSADGKVSLQ